jgi:hypothetical protein
MLQEIPGVTPSGSVGIAEEWKSFRRIMEGFERKAGDEGVGSARILLEGCKVSPNRLLSTPTGRLADRFLWHESTGPTLEDGRAEREERRAGRLDAYPQRVAGERSDISRLMPADQRGRLVPLWLLLNGCWTWTWRLVPHVRLDSCCQA